MEIKEDFIVNLLFKKLEKYSTKDVSFNKKDLEEFIYFLIDED
tara:strand:- start:8023 stop:8151 length:129 start_codon:yes stop_codon:yes gene_type:complete